jgi:hypothetical protein
LVLTPVSDVDSEALGVWIFVWRAHPPSAFPDDEAACYPAAAEKIRKEVIHAAATKIVW